MAGLSCKYLFFFMRQLTFLFAIPIWKYCNLDPPPLVRNHFIQFYFILFMTNDLKLLVFSRFDSPPVLYVKDDEVLS
jgi:hypothetical protein